MDKVSRWSPSSMPIWMLGYQRARGSKRRDLWTTVLRMLVICAVVTISSIGRLCIAARGVYAGQQPGVNLQRRFFTKIKVLSTRSVRGKSLFRLLTCPRLAA